MAQATRVRGDCRKQIQYRFPGRRPRAWILDRLCRRHPNVSLAWVRGRNRWAMIQTDRTPPHFIQLLEDEQGNYVEPTLENTVGYLDKCSLDNFRNQWAINRWMEQNLIDEPVDPVVEDRVAGRVEELADRIWQMGKVVVPRKM